MVCVCACENKAILSVLVTCGFSTNPFLYVWIDTETYSQKDCERNLNKKCILSVQIPMNTNEIILAKTRQSKLLHTNNFNLCRVPWDFLWIHMIGLADMLWQALDGILTSPTGAAKKQRVKVNFSSHSARIYYEHIIHAVQHSVNTYSWLKRV